MENDKLLTDEQFLPCALNLVESAQKLIYISTFKVELTTKPRGRDLHNFFEHVFEKSRLGVDVRFLTNTFTKRGSIPLSNFHAIQELSRRGVQVRILQGTRICHAKLLIIDDATVILGSHNLSVKSCHNNFEVSYILTNPYVIGQLQGVYQEVWDTARKL